MYCQTSDMLTKSDSEFYRYQSVQY